METSSITSRQNTDDDMLAALARRWRALLMLAILGGPAGYGASFLFPPIYQARTILLPPQQQGSAASALASLGALASLAGVGGSSLKTQTDQFVGLLESTTIGDQIIDHFKLMSVYNKKYRDETEKQLAKRTQISVGKKDGLITIAVEDTDASRAAAIADRYVEELRLLTSRLAVTEAQQRRIFFENQLQDTKSKLTAAQTALQESGFTLGALRSEPRSAAESYARLRAEATASEVRLQTLRGAFAENTPEVQQELTRLDALRTQLRSQEQPLDAAVASGKPDYIGKYREFKYEEALFELFARQYEIAKVDESREGALIQVVDAAKPPERKSRPTRSLFALGGLLLLPTLFGWYIVSRARFSAAMTNPERAHRWQRIRDALRGA